MMKAKELVLTKDWDKTFPISEKVEHKKVTFVNRYGIILAADMYTPKDAMHKMSAIAVSGPFGAVKEQASGLYAQEMAERGFLMIAFDPSFTGESGGEPRYVASPDINTEDFSAAMDTRIKAIEMKPGDCINIPADVKHWHGAAPDSWFSHLAIEVPSKDGSNEWLGCLLCKGST